MLKDLAGPSDANAPRLWAYEIRNVVLQGLRRERIGREDAIRFMRPLAALQIRLLDPPYDEFFEAAARFDLSFYDAATLDRRLRAAAEAANVAVYGETA